MSAGSGTPLRTPSDFYSNPNWYRCEARPHSTSSARRLGPKIGRPLSSSRTDKQSYVEWRLLHAILFNRALRPAFWSDIPDDASGFGLPPRAQFSLAEGANLFARSRRAHCPVARTARKIWPRYVMSFLTSCSLMWRKHQCKRLWAILLFDSMLQTRLPRV